MREGFQLAKKNGLYGYLSLEEGNYVVKIPFQFEDGWDFNQGFAPVKKRGKWSFIDRKGIQVTPFIYDRVISRPTDDFVIGCVQEGKNTFCIDRQGNCINFDKFYCTPSEEQVQQKVITPKSFSLPDRVINSGKSGDRLVKIKQSGKEILQDPTGRFFEPGGGGEIFTYLDGMAMVKLTDKLGFVNQSGLLVVPPAYTGAKDFSEGLAAVEKNGKWGFLNKQGELQIPLRYDKASSFIKGQATVTQNGKTYQIDRSGTCTGGNCP
jgi:hypothetical protein